MPTEQRAEVHRWGMVYWLNSRGTLLWKDKETGEQGVLTASDDPKSAYQIILAELRRQETA